MKQNSQNNDKQHFLNIKRSVQHRHKIITPMLLHLLLKKTLNI